MLCQSEGPPSMLVNCFHKARDAACVMRCCDSAHCLCALLEPNRRKKHYPPCLPACLPACVRACVRACMHCGLSGACRLTDSKCSACMRTCLSLPFPAYACNHPCLSVCLPACPPLRLSICLPACLCVCCCAAHRRLRAPSWSRSAMQTWLLSGA